ncbi:UNVERIFIED_CONTAM: ABC transporter G family member 28 [Sesamum angustifolium]|uniref:ABC transporter G family member 28 n=1 Tax=Sesamum angustifolium TaxID=2727405 RepID=A0AAW2PSE4_9LAMI
MCSCGNCTCGSNKAKLEEIEENQLIQFLMGLSEPYDSIRSQILVLDPFPSVNKAYSMVLRVERQRRVNLEYADVGENTAMNTRNMEYKLHTGHRTFQKRKGSMEKKQMICEHCCKPGHNKETCFKLHGIPEWYKDLNEQKKRGTFNNRVYVATEAQNSDDKGSTQRADIISELMEALKLVQTKVHRIRSKFHFAHDTEMADFIHPSDLASSHTDFLAALSTIQELVTTCKQRAVKSGKMLCHKSLVLERNNTWEVVTLPKGKKAIGSKWVFKIKLKADGSIDRYKARLVAKGYNQVEGVDYVDRFSPVAKAVTVRIFLAVASSHGWPIHQVDINNAFLHGFLDEDIYMHAPDGYHVQPGQVCKLKRSLYGLKQASRQWNLELTTRLIAFGFHQSSHDHCLFTQTTGAGLVALIVYVDDVLITCPSEDKITEVKHFLDAAFTIKDLGHANYHPSSIPLIDPEPYRRLVGRLLYLSFTRPDISFGAQQLSQFVHAPCTIHMEAALHLVRYLKGCPERGLFFPASTPFTLTAYCDADWASCVDSRRSLTGYCIFLGAALISWKTKKQTTVARSTAEAEYRSLGTTVCELQWVTYLLSDLSIQVPTPIPLYCDNQAAIHIVANPVFHERTKHTSRSTVTSELSYSCDGGKSLFLARIAIDFPVAAFCWIRKWNLLHLVHVNSLIISSTSSGTTDARRSCPLGSYCPLATYNGTTGLCDPYLYQLPSGKPNHTCGGANIWADVSRGGSMFCPAGSYCPTTNKKYLAQAGCYKLTSCDANTTRQNITQYGLLLIVAISVLLFIFYNCYEQVITIRGRRYARSREAAAKSVKENAQARARWLAAKDAVKKRAIELQSQVSRSFSRRNSIISSEHVRILSQTELVADDYSHQFLSHNSSSSEHNDAASGRKETGAGYPPIQEIEDSSDSSDGFDAETENKNQKRKQQTKHARTNTQIFKYAYSQLEKEKAQLKRNRDLTLSGVISMATNSETRRRPPVEIAFRDLTVTLKQKKKHLLRSVTGEIRPGRITALMGPSGAGKTTLLSALAGKTVGCSITGLVLINGRGESIRSYKKIVGFVPQDDIVHGNLTVEENIWFSANCRLSAELPKADKVLVVERVIESLGLQPVRDSLVGTVEKRGISGGQRKRVNVGLELVMEPSLLFLDEPTSGLDSSSSQLLLRALRREALEGVNICMVVHQPSYSLFKMFDDLILLAKGGLTVYHGQ